MTHTHVPAGQAEIRFLLAPRDVLLIDVFRALGDFEIHYDIGALDRLERRLGDVVDPVSAKNIVSDALLLAFALRSEREFDWNLRAPGERRATEDEYRLLALVSATHGGDDDGAAQAAHALGVPLTQTIASLARDIGSRLTRAGAPVTSVDWRLVSREPEPVVERIAARL